MHLAWVDMVEENILQLLPFSLGSRLLSLSTRILVFDEGAYGICANGQLRNNDNVV